MPERNLPENGGVVVAALAQRGVALSDIAAIVHDLQSKHCPGLTVDDCLESVRKVLAKREVQQAILTGIAVDVMAEQGLLPEPLLTIIVDDDPLFGVDEILALAITNVYGSIGLTNFGYLDREKPGLLAQLNAGGRDGREVHTFLDDLVAGVAAAAAAKIAHGRGPRRHPARRPAP
ncbi:MAG: phosphatidylglycerophosphatase A family protein [Bacillota bacterium]